MPQSQEETVAIRLTEVEIESLLERISESTSWQPEIDESIEKKLRQAKEFFPHNPEPPTDAKAQ